jgi:hypothetical protein
MATDIPNTPEAVVAYIKGGELVVAELGDCGDMQGAKHQLSEWVDKVAGEMGYELIFAGLVRMGFRMMLDSALKAHAERKGVEVRCTRTWEG